MSFLEFPPIDALNGSDLPTLLVLGVVGIIAIVCLAMALDAAFGE